MYKKQTKLLGGKHLFGNYQSYKFYRENSKYKKNINQWNLHIKFLSEVYKKVANDSIEYEGGVFAPKFFYIIPHAYPKKMLATISSKDGLKKTMNVHSKGLVYTMLFVNLLTNPKSKFWSMDGSFFKSVRKKLQENLTTNYPKYFFSLDSLLKAK